MDKKIFIIIAIVVIFGGLFWMWQAGFFTRNSQPVKPVPIPEGILLFYGEGCHFCQIVEDFISQNNIEEKIQFNKLEVWSNLENQTILAEVTLKCSIDAKEVGIPFLYDGENNKCYIGDIDVINFLKDKTGIQ